MGGHHGPKLPDIPDWRIYRVEDVPQLMEVKKNLASRGLHYPWLRNEVWKYSVGPTDKFGLKALKHIFRGGFKYGVGAAIVTIIAEKAYLAYIEKLVEEADGGHH